MSEYYSQSGQDEYLDTKVFNKKEFGVFIDIGAHDGISYSNTFFFEKVRHWSGLCIEPIPERCEELKINRKCKIIQGCISDEDGEKEFTRIHGYSEMLSGLSDKYDQKHQERIEKEISLYGGSVETFPVQCHKIDSLLNQNNLNKIDYCSIDTEGSELDIINTINFNEVCIDYFSIENNNQSGILRRKLRSEGYFFIGRLGSDDIFGRSELIGFFNLKRWYFLFNMSKKLFNFAQIVKNKIFK